MNQGAENTAQHGKERGLSKFSRFKEESKLQDDDDESDSVDLRSVQATSPDINVAYLAEKDETRDNIIGGPLKFKFTEEKATSSSKHEEHDASSLNMLEVEKNARSEG